MILNYSGHCYDTEQGRKSSPMVALGAREVFTNSSTVLMWCDRISCTCAPSQSGSCKTAVGSTWEAAS